MDLGFFESSRLRFWLWIAVPPVVAVVVTVGSMLWLQQERDGLEKRQALLADLPMLEVQVRKADALLKSITPGANQTPVAAEAVSRRVEQAAKNAGLTIRSLKFGEGGEAAGGLAAFKVAIQVQGPMRAVVQWLDEIQKPGVLLGLGQADWTALSAPPDDIYAGDLTFVIYLRSI